MSKFSLWLLSLLVLPVTAAQIALPISDQVFDNSSLAFIEHNKDKPFGRYLTQNIQYPPIKALHKTLQLQLQQALINRGEAHITVVTPPEFDRQLKPHISIEQINKIARDMNIQDAQFELVCLGRGQVRQDNKTLSTYFVVVESPQLLAIRQAVHDKFVENGGDAKAFKPTHFYPHITVGYTDKDLHESQGVFKDKRSCYRSLTLTSPPKR